MQGSLALKSGDRPGRSVEPLVDLGAYEALWADPRATFRSIADLFNRTPGALPSDLVPRSDALEMANRVLEILHAAGIRNRWGIRVYGAGEYPEKLRDAEYPVELLYYRVLS